MATDGAADAEVVRIHHRAVHLDLLALDPEVGDPVLPTAVRTTRNVDPELLVEPRQALLEGLDEPAREALRLGERQLAELGARARDGAAPERRGLEREAGGLELARQRVSALAADVRDQEILHAGGPERTRAVAVGQVGHCLHLIRRDAPPEHGDAHVAVARLPLRVDADMVAIRIVRRVIGHARRERSVEALLDRGLEARGRPAVLEEQELETSPLAVLPEHVGIAEDLGDRPDHCQRASARNERIEPDAEVRVGREPTTDADGKADLARFRVTDRREADVVDLGIRAPGPAARDGDLELPRKVVEGRVAVHQLRRLQHERRGVEQLVGVQTGDRAAGDVPRDVAARAHAGHTLQPERVEDLRQALERHPVELDVLADRDVGDAATVPLGDIRDGPELVRLEPAARNPDSHHQMPNGLPLAALPTDRADPVALRVDAPPAEVRAEPLGRDRVPALAREALDVGIGFPGIQLALEPLYTLRLGLFHGLAHGCLQKRKAGRRAFLRPYPRLVSLVSTSPQEGAIFSVYRRGTCTQALHRAHLAITRPVGGSTRRTALWMTTSFWSATTTFALQTGQRSDGACSTLAVIPVQWENTHCRSRLSRETRLARIALATP